MLSNKPLSALTDIEQTSSNFPSCKMALTYDKFSAKNTGGLATGATITDDAFSGMEITFGGPNFSDENGSILRSAGAGSTTISTGALPNIGTKDVLFVSCQDFADGASLGSIYIGDPVTGVGVNLGHGEGYGLTVSGTNYSIPANPATIGTPVVLGMCAISYKQDGTTKQHLYDGVNDLYDAVEHTYAPATKADVAGIDWQLGTTDNTIEFNAVGNYRDVFIFSFDTLPSDEFIQGLLAWMYANPNVTYPGLKDMT